MFTDLYDIQKKLNQEVVDFHSILKNSRKEQEKRLIFLFQCDLLPGISGQILQSKGNRDFAKPRPIEWKYKCMGWITILIINASMLFYILLFALQQSDHNQNAWFRSFLLWILMDIVIVSSMIVVIHYLFFRDSSW